MPTTVTGAQSCHIITVRGYIVHISNDKRYIVQPVTH